MKKVIIVIEVSDNVTKTNILETLEMKRYSVIRYKEIVQREKLSIEEMIQRLEHSLC